MGARARGILVLIACSGSALITTSSCSSSKNKNDQVAACQAQGGRWVESGCSSGHCEPPGNTTAPLIAGDDDDDDDADEDAATVDVDGDN
jgi:hypothetical protein